MPSNMCKTASVFWGPWAPARELGGNEEAAPLCLTFWEYNGLWQPSLPGLILITLPVSPWRRGKSKDFTDLEQTPNLATYHTNTTVSTFIPPRV